MKKEIIIPVVIVLLAGSFYGGVQYDKSQVSATANVGQGGRGGVRTGTGNSGGGARGFGGGNAVSGAVLSLSNSSLTVKLRDGSSKIVLFASSTVISKQTVGAIGDVSVGSEITVIGSANNDGSVTAQNIQLRPPSSTRPF